ncbi:MAG: hypothetical protein ACE5DZ_09635 [Mariprofundus sp.]
MGMTVPCHNADMPVGQITLEMIAMVDEYQDRYLNRELSLLVSHGPDRKLVTVKSEGGTV